VDVRLVAATNKDLAKLVSEGKFRDDLFFRLSVVPIQMPPLRARKEDIPLLVQAFLKAFSEENAKPFKELSPEAMQAILRYDWPGNVRELRTAIEHGVVMSTGAKISMRDLPMSVRQGGSGGAGAAPTRLAPAARGEHFNLQANEHQLILEALEETGGNVTRAARKLGISRRTLHRKLKELRPDEASPESASPRE
jgi:DNA-binding NtrC family response regulator